MRTTLEAARIWLVAVLMGSTVLAQSTAPPMVVLFGPQGTVPIAERLAPRTLSGTIVEVAHPTLGPKSVKEMIERSKATAGGLNYGTTGVNSSQASRCPA